MKKKKCDNLNGFVGQLRASEEITDELFESLRSVGAVRPRMYGLPKLHKSRQPLRPILSMTGAPQYNVSKWLCRLLDPVVKVYSTRCIKDSFAFVDLLKSSVPLTAAGYMCSFDVVSLFTNVPVEETIDICMKALYHSEISEQPPITEQSFRVLLRMVMTGVEFSFDDMMYRQVDGVAMGSPLGPVLANIFVGYCESRVPETMWPSIYCRFVDDTFGFFLKTGDKVKIC